MKINLKKKLAQINIVVFDDEYLKAQGNLLKSIVYPEDDDCELGNSAKRLPNYPEDDNDNYDEDYDDKDLFLDNFRKGY